MRKILNESQIDADAAKVVSTFNTSIVNEVEQAVLKNDWVIVGMTQNPLPKKARELLQSKNIKFVELTYGSYFSMWHERLSIKMWSGWPTFPQIFHKGKLIGGFTDLKKYLDK
jgi:monothiol glutaredoxin